MPRQYLGEAEKDEGGKNIGSLAAVEADAETAAPTIEAVGADIEVVSFVVHNTKILRLGNVAAASEMDPGCLIVKERGKLRTKVLYKDHIVDRELSDTGSVIAP